MNVAEPKKTLLLIRHCASSGQQPDAGLTAEGHAQAEMLSAFLAGRQIDRIVSSPYRRALQSIEPFAQSVRMQVDIDSRLVERLLSHEFLERTSWLDALEQSYGDLDFCLPGGESARAAMRRAIAVIDEQIQHATGTVALVTHGNLMALALKSFDPRFGFEHWRALTNPDVYAVTIGAAACEVQRLWDGK